MGRHGAWAVGCALWLATLAGCALAPGQRMVQSESVRVTAPSAAGAAGATSITPQTITPDLIAGLRARREPQAQQLAALLKPQGAAAPYRIGVGDVLGITVWGHPDLSLPPAVAIGSAPDTTSIPQGFSVGQSGEIQFAFANRLRVQGLTETEARDLLVRSLAPYVREPQVTLRVQAYRSQKIYVDGEVRSPGQLVINDLPMTLAEALGRSGGITPAGDSSQIVVVRAGQRHVVDLTALAARGLTATDLLLQSGDTVRVTPREESKVSVLGEVARPGALVLRNGRLSLQEALAEVGGIQSATADARQVYVIRGADTDAPRLYHLDAQSPVMLALANRFDLQAHDIVYVDAAPLALWNRVITLLVPSVGAAQSTNNTLNNR